jgi:hypothetical protein
LTNSDLVGANLCGVDLDRANLKGARLKSVVSDRRTKLSTVTGHKTNSNTNLMVKERPIVESETIAHSATPTKIQYEPTQAVQSIKATKKKPGTNPLGILLLGVVTTVTVAGYIFWTQNPDYPWSLKLKVWQSQLEQLMPEVK